MPRKKLSSSVRLTLKNFGSSEKGGALITLIVGMVLMSAVTAGIATTMSSSPMSEVQANHAARAYYIAESGFRYVYASFQADPDNWQDEFEGNPTYQLPGGGKLEIHDLDPKDELTATVSGEQTVNEGGTLTVNNASDFLDYKGLFSINGKNYKYFSKDGNNLVNIKGFGHSSFPIIADDGDEVVTLPGVEYKSTGTFPSSGSQSVSRTLTFFQVLLESGGGGGAGNQPDMPVKTANSQANLSVGGHGHVEGDVAGNNVELGHNATVTGNVTAVEDVTLLPNNSKVGGSVCAGGDVTLGHTTEVIGDVNARGEVKLESNNSKVGGSVFAEENITLGSNTEVEGDVHTGGTVTLESSNSRVLGTVYAGEDIKLGDKTLVEGDVHAGGIVTLESSKSRVLGNIYAEGNVILGHKTVVEGSIHSAGNVKLTTQGTVEGNVTAKGDISLADKSVIEGDAVAGGKITVGWKCKIMGDIKENHPDPNPETPKPPVKPQTCPETCVPEHTEFTAGGPDITVPWHQDVTIDPGSYNKLKLDDKNKVYLSSGDYFFNAILPGWKTSLYLDLSGGDINIFVTGDVKFGSQLDIHVKTPAEDAWKKINENVKEHAAGVFLETLGDFSTGWQSDWFGTIFSEGKINFSGQNLVIGAFYSSEGEIYSGWQMDTFYVPSRYAQENLTYNCGSSYIPPYRY